MTCSINHKMWLTSYYVKNKNLTCCLNKTILGCDIVALNRVHEFNGCVFDFVVHSFQPTTLNCQQFRSNAKEMPSTIFSLQNHNYCCRSCRVITVVVAVITIRCNNRISCNWCKSSFADEVKMDFTIRENSNTLHFATSTSISYSVANISLDRREVLRPFYNVEINNLLMITSNKLFFKFVCCFLKHSLLMCWRSCMKSFVSFRFIMHENFLYVL